MSDDGREFKPDLLLLNGSVQHYDWGGYGFIPRLLGIENKEAKPFAELWIGAPPKSPATARISGKAESLERIIASAPESILGAGISSRFGGRLPYLLKILDVRAMLSIQAHPGKNQAAEGFARENAEQIDVQSTRRNYRDANHKPEVHVALTEFWMLHGFRPLEEIARTFSAVPELSSLMPDFDRRLAASGRTAKARRDLLRALYATVMRMPQDRVDALLNPLITRFESEKPKDKTKPAFWVLRAAMQFPLPGGHRDRGIFSIFLLNLLRLLPGQGTFQPPGVLHAYLEGINIELMANSDNVLRGGLTLKHVDVDELMRSLSFESGSPGVISGDPVTDIETLYKTPVDEFELSRIEIVAEKAYARRDGYGPDSLIVLDGAPSVKSDRSVLSLQRGDIVLAPHGVGYTIESLTGRAVLYKASVPTI